MANIGNRDASLSLQCPHCEWRPEYGVPMEAVQLHSQVEHATDGFAFEVVAACTCSATMTVTATTSTGPQDHAGMDITSYLLCPACGNTGHVRRGTN